MSDAAINPATGHSLCVCVKCGPPWRNEPKPEFSKENLKWWQWASWMALCAICGSKRCPGALDHELECDGRS